MVIRSSVLLAFLLISCAGASAQSQPEHRVTSFDFAPALLFFFDDSQSVVYHDAVDGNVHVSQDEGKTWRAAQGIAPNEALTVIPHPFDNKIAFVLSLGTRHYRTDDRGKTWRSFDVPYPPSMMRDPFSFHSDPQKYGHIIYHGTACDASACHDETFYTTDAFSSPPKLLLTDTIHCQFAHGSKDFKHDAHPNLIYCVAYSTSTPSGSRSYASRRLYSSTDFFDREILVEDLGIGKNAKGAVAFAIVSKFALVALRDLSPGHSDEMLLYVTVDTKTWAQAQFPHASSARLRENAYTIVKSTTHSLAVDVVLQDRSAIGTLFVSNSNGTYFVESLKDTNRNSMGYVDFERLYGIEGVGLANVVSNAQEVEALGANKQLKTMITFDDGSSWSPIRPPTEDIDGKKIACDPDNRELCSLHLHSVTNPHRGGRVFSSPAPGFAMGVGSIGSVLKPYDECDTFLSTDAGVTWKMVSRNAHLHEFGDQGSIIVAASNEEVSDTIKYSLNQGKTWETYNLDFKFRALAFFTLPDATSQKFLLLGKVPRSEQSDAVGRVVVVYLNFTKTRKRKCGEGDFEKWYARTASDQCLMGHKQWYKRRKPDVDCYVGQEFDDIVEHEDPCACTDEDYECDYNYVRNGKECIPSGLEPIPPGVCTGNPDQTYTGSSGYRKVPGNTCVGGVEKDKQGEKKCSQAQPEEGNIVHQTFQFDYPISQHAYFRESTTILVRLQDNSVWQSRNEGYSWTRLFPDHRFMGFYLHKYSSDRAYLFTDTKTVYYTTDAGRQWHTFNAPTPPNSVGVAPLQFHPNSEYLIWTGDKQCDTDSCHLEAQYSRDNGRRWTIIESYVRNCAWAKDTHLNADPNEILCESYRNKSGNQKNFQNDNPLELVIGSNFFRNKRKLFNHVVGFAKFSEYLVVAEYVPEKGSLVVQVSLDGINFAVGKFPPNMHPQTHAYTILESSTKSLFLHMTMSEPPAPYWGNILKSNSNGTYFGVATENVNRDNRGYVDFEKMIGLDGIALVNVVANPSEASMNGHKILQSLITHNDGSTWKPLPPPSVDSHGRPYDCTQTSCSLHVHGYTERIDPRATYSSPSVVGLLMAVGNVGESLAPYTESDTFLSRDAGFSWEEVHKDAHLWEFGDSGSILVMANDEEPTDHLLFSTNEGITWREYKFTEEKIRVRSIVTVPADTSRRFLLFGQYARSLKWAAVHVDFSSLTWKKCVLDEDNPGKDDFELWSPSSERSERCLFGRQTLYHRRAREAECVVGIQPKVEARHVLTCPCSKVDFECEFNYVKNAADECVLVPGTNPLPDDDSCKTGEKYWYERTAYRKIPYSSCEDGQRLDRGKAHPCPGFKSKGALFWFFMLFLPFGFTGMVAFYYYQRSGLARGTIRLPGDVHRPAYGGDTGIMETLASVPWFIIGISGIVYQWIASRVDNLRFRSRRGYRNVPIDEDAQILRFEDEE